MQDKGESLREVIWIQRFGITSSKFESKQLTGGLEIKVQYTKSLIKKVKDWHSQPEGPPSQADLL